MSQLGILAPCRFHNWDVKFDSLIDGRVCIYILVCSRIVKIFHIDSTSITALESASYCIYR